MDTLTDRDIDRHGNSNIQKDKPDMNILTNRQIDRHEQSKKDRN